MMEYILIIIGTVLVNNFVLVRFLGICPFLGVSKDTESALGMGFAVVFVMTVSSVLTYALYVFVLSPLELEYLMTITFVLVIAALVQGMEVVIKKTSPSLYESLGIYLPLISTNCAVMGVALLNITNISEIDNILKAFLNGFGSGAGFMLAMVLMAGIRERLEGAQVPESFKGFPISLIAASIMAMAFAGFASLI